MNASDFINVSVRGGVVVAGAVVTRALIGFVTQIAFARLLAPEVFGQLAFAATVALFFNTFTNLRGDVFVIHEQDSPKLAADVAFTLELIAAIFISILVFLLAPFMMAVLGKSDLTIYVQVFVLSFFYNPFTRSRSLLERNLSFLKAKSPFLIAQIFGSVSSIAFAYWGCGIWSLLWWRLSVLGGEVIILLTFAPYKPRLRWDPNRSKRLINFTWPLVVSAILSFFCYNVDYFIVGQVLDDGAIQLGYYWVGFQAATYVLMSRQILYDVLFPVFSRLDNHELKKQAFIKFTRAVTGIFLILTILVLSFGRDIIVVLYGLKWEPAVLPFQIIFVVAMMRAIDVNCGYYLYSCGKTRPELTSVLISSTLLVPTTYLGTIYLGINGTALAVLFVQIIVSVVIYEGYIRPVTNKGVLYFFFWPWLIAGATFGSTTFVRKMGMPLAVILLVVALLFVVAYGSVLRHVYHDITKALKAANPLEKRIIPFNTLK